MKTVAQNRRPVAMGSDEVEALAECRRFLGDLAAACEEVKRGDLGSRLVVGGDAASPLVEAANAFNALVEHLGLNAGESRSSPEPGLGSAQSGEPGPTDAARAAERRDGDLKVLQNIVAVSMSTIEMSVASTTIANATREAQMSGATMASAVEQLAASIKDIETSARQTAETAGSSQGVTASGQTVLDTLAVRTGTAERDFDAMAQKTHGLQSSVVALAGVVDTISKIADQTNLLALNATIEAARAGELGKGFAVVAGEVKSLSRQTRAATDTIRDQIESLNASFTEVFDTVGRARDGVHALGSAVASLGASFAEMGEGSVAIADRTSSLVGILGQQREAVESLARNMASLKASSDSTLEAARGLQRGADNNLRLVERWREDSAQCDVPNREVYLAKADHLLWKKTILDFANGTNAHFGDLKGPAECRLGRWLAGQPADAAWRGAIAAPHARVHQEGILAARCFINHQAVEGFTHYHAMEEASAAVVDGLDTILEALSHEAPEGTDTAGD